MCLYNLRNVFIQLEHAILYPEYVNTKTSTTSCMRWEKNHFAWVLGAVDIAADISTEATYSTHDPGSLRTSHPHRCCFARGSTKVKH